MVVRRIERRVSRRSKATLWFTVLAVLALILAGSLLWQAPQGQPPAEVTDPGERSELQDKFRRTGAEIILGGLALAGLYLLWRRVSASERTAAIFRDYGTTERFNQAIEQLANPSPAISLGGIYTLERIARASPNGDHWQVMEVLTAYVREHARWSAVDHRNGNGATEANGVSPEHSIPANVQAALAVLARRDCSGETLEQRLNLTATDLRGADLEQAQLQRADLTGANLKGARLGGACLDSAILEGAILVDARLVGASLAEARLRGANLAGAKLWDAQLQGADLQAANLEGASLGGADLSWARLWDAKLQGADLQGAKLDGALGLPEDKEPVKAAAPQQPPAPIAHYVPTELPAISPISGRQSQTMVYLNGIKHGRRRNGSNNSSNGHGHENSHANGNGKGAVEEIPAAEPEPVSWGSGDEDS